MTCSWILLDSAQRCLTSLASAKWGELILVSLALVFWALLECPLDQLLSPTLTELLSRRVRPVSIFSLYLRGCYTQEQVVQEQKGTFSVSGENYLILHRTIKYSLVYRGRGLFGWEGKAMASLCPIDCLVGNT